MVSRSFVSRYMGQGCLLFIFMVLCGLYAWHLGQDCNYDLRNYHWYNAYSFIHHRFDIDIAAAGKGTYNNPVLDLINYFIIQSMPNAQASEFALGALHGIAVYFLLKIALIVFSPFRFKWFYATIAVFLGVTGVASLHQIGATYNESQVTIFIMISLYLFSKAIHEGSKQYWEYGLAGLILGIGVAAKLTAFPYAVGMLLSLSCYKGIDKKTILFMLVASGCSLLGFLMVDGLWMIKMYQHFQSPFFPYYNTIFHSPYAEANTAIDMRLVPPSMGQALLYPFYWMKENVLTQEFPMKDPRIAVMIVLGLFLLSKQIYQKVRGRGNRILSPTVQFLLLFFCLSFAIWMAQFSMYRYTIPLNFLAGVFIVYFCLHLVSNRLMRATGVILLTATVIWQTYSPIWDRAPYHHRFFTIEIPAPLPEHALVLLMNNALSYLVPYFPASNQFVGYYNDFVQSGNPGLYKAVSEKIKHFNGSIYAIFIKQPSIDLPKIKENLAFSGLSIEQCQTIKSNVEVRVIQLCLVSKQK